MSRLHKVPSYRLHKQSGQAIVTLVDPAGIRKDVLLGEFGSQGSREAYARVIAEWEVNRRQFPKKGNSPSDLTVNEIIVRFWQFAEQHYRHPSGEPTGELENFRTSLRPLRQLYGDTAATDFGPLALKTVRQRMIENDPSRRVVNQRIGRIKYLFKWAVSEELIPSSVYEALRTVSALGRGRTEARETAPVKPVEPEAVEAVLPFLSPHVRPMVELMRLTGMRPGETCSMQRRLIDMSGPIWIYSPDRHKNAWRGQGRVIALGPKAQAIIKPFLRAELNAYLFSPKEGMLAIWSRQRQARKSKVYPSQSKPRTKNLRRLRDRYTTAAVDLAIHRACDKARIDRWSANRLRHLHATEVRKLFGIEAASTALGHHRLNTTEIYAEKNRALAERVAAELG